MGFVKERIDIQHVIRAVLQPEICSDCFHLKKLCILRVGENDYYIAFSCKCGALEEILSDSYTTAQDARLDLSSFAWRL